ncbi:MAG TPA: cob(I)yrinic acid a,c-diamide adenosyltransferase [Sphingomicrobium sp.]
MVKLNKIYTRTGDGGSAGLVDGSRVSKSSLRMIAIGEVDEANAAIGVAVAALQDRAVELRLLEIQNDLFDLGADVATPGDVEGALRIVASQVERLEAEIDAMNAMLEPLTSFILPGGSQGVAALHLARTIVRRAERAAVALNEAETLNPFLIAYLNRLSDHLFVSARFVAAGEGGDVLWTPGKSRGG